MLIRLAVILAFVSMVLIAYGELTGKEDVAATGLIVAGLALFIMSYRILSIMWKTYVDDNRRGFTNFLWAGITFLLACAFCGVGVYRFQ